MSNTKKKKNMNKAKEIKTLKEEIVKNDDVVKRNIETKDTQIHISLIQNHGYNPNNPMYNTFLERMEFDLLETNMKLKDHTPLYPVFAYQKNPEWLALQLELLDKHKKALVEAISDLKEQIHEAEKIILEQNERWGERRVLLIDRLKELKVDVKDFAEPSYIG